MSKINILVINTDTIGGVGFYRSRQPHEELEKMFPDEFHVTYESNPNFSDLESFSMFDIIHIHKGVFNTDEQFLNAMRYFKEHGIVTIMDLDDHWKLDFRHPQNYHNKVYKTDEKIKRNLGLFDYVTTTTKFFKNEIKPFNKNVEIFPNAIDPTDERFIVNKEKCDKLRIGLIMGSTHEYDMMIMDNFVSKLPKDVLDKVEFVLCGFDTRGTVSMFKQDGSVEQRPMRPEETVWYRYEKMLTDNYKIVSPQYKQFLEQFIVDAQWNDCVNEGYKRCWTKDINHYYQHYKEIDVLLAPLEITDFNKVKSQLKVVESAFSHTAIVASDFGPYTIDLKNAFIKGGGIDETANAILIDERKNHKDWAKAVEKLVKNPELVTMLQNNLYNSIKDEYDLRNQTKRRADFYKKIIEEKQK